MYEETFVRHALTGADALLAVTNCHIKTVNVLSLQKSPNLPCSFILSVDDYVKEGAQVFYRERPCPFVEIRTVKMRRYEKLVYISLPQEKCAAFAALSPSDLTIRSDMSFLIERTCEFYQEHALCFSPPQPETPAAPACPVALSEEQASAVDTVLSAPVSYVWGAPGTGKTRHVLATCILRYLSAGKRVLLLAPTNNAVENALRAILPALRSCGIDLKKAYRLGSSTYEFQSEFPEVTPDGAFLAQLSELQGQIAATQEHLLRLYQNRKDSVPLSATLEAQQKAGPLLEALLQEQQDAQSQINFLSDQLPSLQTLYTQRLEEKQLADAALLALPRPSLWARLRPRARREAKEALDSARASAAQAAAALSVAKESFRAAQRELAEHTRDLDLCPIKILQLMRSVSVPCTTTDTPEILRRSLAESLARTQSTLASLEESAGDISALEKTLSQLQQAASRLEISDALQQKQRALLLAGTLDSAWSVLDEAKEHPFAHIMVDEAAYLPLAKAMVCFSANCPVAFFGDHYQLPPVCELSDQAIRQNPEACLWALPSILYSELCSSTMEQMFSVWQDPSHRPDFSSLAYAPLYNSWRFDNRLATVLDRVIYRPKGSGAENDPPFHGSSAHPLKITICNAPKREGAQTRRSQAEADAIRCYLHANPPAENSTAILTPYRNQYELLRPIGNTFGCPVSTVHKAQGLEWDRVILSVVDTDSCYFTDTSLPVGRKCLNTAISRVRRELVIVCDVARWKNRPQQLLAQLIALDDSAVAKDIPSFLF